MLEYLPSLEANFLPRYLDAKLGVRSPTSAGPAIEEMLQTARFNPDTAPLAR